MSGAAIVLVYLERWRTELAYKMLKHHLAWGNYHVTDFGAVISYQKLGLVAYTLAKRAQAAVATDIGLPTLLNLRRRAEKLLMPTGKIASTLGGNHDPDSIKAAA